MFGSKGIIKCRHKVKSESLPFTPLDSAFIQHKINDSEKVMYVYLKFPPKPLLCCNVCANISYLRMSLSLTDRRANFIASSK